MQRPSKWIKEGELYRKQLFVSPFHGLAHSGLPVAADPLLLPRSFMVKGATETFAGKAHVQERKRDRRMAESTEALFERAIRLHSRRLLAIAQAIVGNRSSAEY